MSYLLSSGHLTSQLNGRTTPLLHRSKLSEKSLHINHTCFRRRKMLLLKRSLKKHHGKATLQEKNSLKMDLKAFIHLSSGQHVHYSHFGFRPGSFGLEPNLGGNERERIGINRCRESLENTNQPSTGLLPLLPFLFCVSGQSRLVALPPFLEKNEEVFPHQICC